MSDSDNESDVMDEWAEALEESGDADSTNSDSEVAVADSHDAAAAEFDKLEDSPVASSDDVNMEVILDIPVKLSMEIGRTIVNIRSLLQLNQGSVIELDRMAGEPLDVLVNGTLIAHGEVVVVNEKFGIRLTDVVSPAERVKKLR